MAPSIGQISSAGPDIAHLRQTLNSIDHERVLRLRELKIQRRQFLHHRGSDTLSGQKKREQIFFQKREELRKRIQMKKAEELDLQASLSQKKAELIDKLKEREMKYKTKQLEIQYKFLKDDDKTSTVEQNNDANDEDSLSESKKNKHTRIADLYKKSFDVMRKKREENQNPLISTVNKLIQQLRENSDDPDKSGDPFSILSKNVMENFIDGDAPQIDKSDNAPEDTNPGKNSRVNPNNNDTSSPENQNESNTDDSSELKTKETNKCEDQPQERPTGALKLWAIVQKEQKTVRKMSKQDCKQHREQESKNEYTLNENPLQQCWDEPIPKVDGGQYKQESCKSKRSNQTNFSNTRASVLKSNKKQMPLSSNDIEKEQESVSERDLAKETSADTCNASDTKTTSAKRNSIPALKIEKYRELHDKPRNSLVDECIEECDENETETSNAVIIIHEDADEPTTPIQWYDGYRYSFSQRDNEILPDFYYDGTSSCSDQDIEFNNKSLVNLTLTPDNISSIASKQSKNDEPTVNGYSSKATYLNSDKIDVNIDLDIPDAPFSHRSDVSISRLSFNTGSEIPSYGRPNSRLEEGSKRKLSMQTRGSLRALSDVLKEDNRRKHNETIFTESMTLRDISEALAGVAADADEQAQRLESIRKAGLGLRSTERESGVRDLFHTALAKDVGLNRQKMRRNTIEAPGRSMADSSDPVYKFLQRRNQSRTMRRHKTLSDVELKLLAQAPGEDTSVRRHSFSSQQARRRSSGSSVMSIGADSLRRASGSVCSRRPSSELSAVLEGETHHKDNTRPNSVSYTRPHSEAMSNDSRAESVDLPSYRKECRSYSWAPDVSETKEWHVLAMELLANNKGKSSGSFRNVSHMLQCLGDEYRRQTAAMMYEELRYCSYLRLPKHQQPEELLKSSIDTESIFGSRSNSPN